MSVTLIVHSSSANGRPLKMVRFGDVIVIGPEPTPEQRARNARESHEALIRLRDGLSTPGVYIPRRPGVPLYYANKNCSGTVIRELDGRKDVGILERNGIWKPIDCEPLPITNAEKS